jgi:prevent-host-death family protein
VDEQDERWERNERIREAELRADSRRPMGELLEEGVRLSSFASELASAPRTGSSGEVPMPGVAEAKRRFPELIDRIGEGERFIITRHGKPAVALIAPSEESIRPAVEPPPIGLAPLAGTLADWEEIDDVVRDVYTSRPRSQDRSVPARD